MLKRKTIFWCFCENYSTFIRCKKWKTQKDRLILWINICIQMYTRNPIYWNVFVCVCVFCIYIYISLSHSFLELKVWLSKQTQSYIGLIIMSEGSILYRIICHNNACSSKYYALRYPMYKLTKKYFQRIKSEKSFNIPWI